jgi:hypothetical protein
MGKRSRVAQREHSQLDGFPTRPGRARVDAMIAFGRPFSRSVFDATSMQVVDIAMSCDVRRVTLH